jgi:SAM-dependent methyltransferase
MTDTGLLAMRRLLEAPTLAHARAGAEPELLPLLTEDAFELVKRTAREADHGGPSSPEAWAGVFDRLASRSPAASVALYSLGDEGRLQAATDEVVDWLRREGLLGPDRLVVEIGCGIGRFLSALSPQVEAVVGLDVSGVMCAEARARTAGLDNVVVLQTPGRDLSMLEADSADLVLAADSFPYLVSAGLAEAHVSEAARVLSPGGALVVFNWAYVGEPTQHRASFASAAEAAGLRSRRLGEQSLSTWDALIFSAVRDDAPGAPKP